MSVTSLRFANVLGDDVTTVFSRMLRMPAVPEVFGFDPRLQFVHEDDVTRALEHATVTDMPGTFNVAGPGTITWSEACRAGRPAPAGHAAGAHRRRPRCRCGCCGSSTSRPRC